jgi:hypothetical protein
MARNQSPKMVYESLRYFAAACAEALWNLQPVLTEELEKVL